MILVSVTNVFLIVTQIRARTNAKLALNENARLILGKMRDSILDASAATTGGSCPANTLNLTQGATTTLYQINNGVFEIIENANPARVLSSSLVVASSSAPCLFVKISNPAPAKPTVQINLRMLSNSSGNALTEVSQDYELTVSLR